MYKIITIIALLLAGSAIYYFTAEKPDPAPEINTEINTVATTPEKEETQTPDNTPQQVSKAEVAKIPSTFNLSISEKIRVDGIEIEFYGLNSNTYCGDDVATCPDELLFRVTDGAPAKDFIVHQSFYPYKIGQADIMVRKMIDSDTFEFSLSPTRF